MAISEDDKLKRTRLTGYKPITKKQPKKKDVKKGYFDPDKVKDNWLFDYKEKCQNEPK